MRENQSLGFPTRSRTNWPKQLQKMARSLKFCIKEEAKTKVLISCAVTAQLICVFVFCTCKDQFFFLFESENMYSMSCNVRKLDFGDSDQALGL